MYTPMLNYHVASEIPALRLLHQSMNPVLYCYKGGHTKTRQNVYKSENCQYIQLFGWRHRKSLHSMYLEKRSTIIAHDKAKVLKM